MQYIQQTHINLKPQTVIEQKLSPLDFTIRRDGQVVLSYELRKYAAFAAKKATQGLKSALKDVLRGAEDCFIEQR